MEKQPSIQLCRSNLNKLMNLILNSNQHNKVNLQAQSNKNYKKTILQIIISSYLLIIYQTLDLQKQMKIGKHVRLQEILLRRQKRHIQKRVPLIHASCFQQF